MLRTLRRSTHAPLLRRLLAVLLGVCVSVTIAEPVFADSCDSDAIAAQDGMHAARRAAVGDTTATGAIARDDSGSPGSRDVPEHAVHFCHCAHSHGSTPTARIGMPERIAFISAEPTPLLERRLASVTTEPQLRPPRAEGAA